jgi:hypothetical protein
VVQPVNPAANAAANVPANPAVNALANAPANATGNIVKMQLTLRTSRETSPQTQGMLTVNFLQPSYEFTFNVGIDLLF